MGAYSHLWALGLVLAGAGAASADDPTELRVGNAVRPWPGRDADGVRLLGGLAVLDSGVCFLHGGTVVAVEAYIHEGNASGEWPRFYAVESADGRTWSVRAESRVANGGGGSAAVLAGTVRLQLEPPLRVETGHCLCWRYPQEARGTIAFARWPGEAVHGPPGGSDAGALAMLGQAPRAPQPAESFTFERVRRRRYAVQACLIPAADDLAAVAQGRSGGSRRTPGPLWRGGTKEELEEWTTKCWGKGWPLSAQPLFCCLPAGQGKPLCFNDNLPFERCCSPDIVGPLGLEPSTATLPAPPQVSLVDPNGHPRKPPHVKVDMYVRTYYQKFEELTLLLRSAEAFWPPDWGVVVALDGGSEPDALACKLLPPWVRCILVDPPPFYGRLNMSFPMLGGSAPGMVWKEWSECWADLHSSADFIAIMDSDVVLTTFGIQHLLFDVASDGRPRPVLWGHAHENYFPSTVEQLRVPNLVDFMDSFPLTLRREDFPFIRRRITALFGRPARRPERARSAFDWAFLEFVRAVHGASIAKGGGGECPSFHSVAGSLLWYGRRSDYAWNIRHGHAMGVPLEFTCPRLRVAHHVPYWSHEHTEHYLTAALKPSLHTPHPLGALGYAARAVALIMAGLCEVPWQQRLQLKRKSGKRLDFASSPNETTAFSNQGLEDVHRDMCEHGTQLVAGVADPFQRLLSWRFPAAPVNDEEVAYCGDRRPSALLQEYRRLMSAIAFTPE